MDSLEQANTPAAPAKAVGDKQLQSLQSMFMQNVSHELRTPLSVIQGYAELLGDGSFGSLDPDQRQAILLIINQTYELRTLVDRIGVLLAAEGGALTWRKVGLQELVAELAAEYRPKADEKGLDITLEATGQSCQVHGDREHLRKAVAAVVENAIKFTPSPGQIKIALSAAEEWVTLVVADTGIGIEKEYLERIFDHFYQIDGSTTRHYGGLGLGLSLVKSVISAHAGRVKVASSPGQGSKFTIQLPNTEHSEQMIDPKRQTSPTKRRIFIVDDEENVATVLGDGLAKLPNCDISVATSGEEAIERLAEEAFDLVITDYKMPGTDGLALAEHIQRLYPQTAVIMISAYVDDELRQQAQEASVQQILDKPFHLAEIRRIAARFLEQLGEAREG